MQREVNRSNLDFKENPFEEKIVLRNKIIRECGADRHQVLVLMIVSPQKDHHQEM